MEYNWKSPSGIYCFTNKISGKRYIGLSTNLRNRYRGHMRAMYCYKKNGQYDASLLHRDMYKFGIDNFTYEVLEYTDDQYLDNREQYWIQKYSTLWPNGYNKEKGGRNCASYRKISETDVKAIQQCLLDGQTQWSIARKFHTDQGTVSHINTGDQWPSTDLSYPLFSMENRYHTQQRHKSLLLDKKAKLIKQKDSDKKEEAMFRRLILQYHEKYGLVSCLATQAHKSTHWVRDRLKKYGLTDFHQRMFVGSFSQIYVVAQISTQSKQVVCYYSDSASARAFTKCYHIIPCLKGQRCSCNGYYWQRLPYQPNMVIISRRSHYNHLKMN